MKSYYYVKLGDTDNVRVDGNDLIVSLQGKTFQSVKVCTACFSSQSEYECPIIRLNTYSGNGFSSDRKGVALCMLQEFHETNVLYKYGLNMEGKPYFISPTLQEISLTLIDSLGVVIPPANLHSFHFILELDSD